ncbi:MAG TPA: extracellular solute-binding protein, partial [Candidatus Poseidoniales archaeon]
MDNKILSLLLSMLMVSMAAAGCLGGDDDDTTTTDVDGCTDSTATNYNPDATVDDGTCAFPPVAGCMDSEASNYDAAAVEEDGSCTYSLTVWHSYALDSTEEEAFNNVIAAFEASHANYDLDVQYVPFDDLKPQYVTAAQAGEAPDVFRLQNDALGEVAANNVGGVSIIEDLAPYMTPAELAAYGTSMSGVTVNGEILGLPQSGDSLALYYNKDVLDTVGVDYGNISNWTFTEFYTAAVTVSMASENHWGLCFPYKAAYQFWPWLTGYGGSIFDDSGNPTINSASTVSAIQTIQLALYGQPAGGTGVLPDGSSPAVLKAGCDWGNMEDMFKDNEVAFIIQGPWAYGGIEASNVNFGHTVMPLSVLEIPFSPFVGMKGWSVSSGSDSKAAAVTLTKYLSGYDSQVEFAKTAKLLPVMSSVLDHPDVASDSVVAGFGAQMARGFGA